MDRDELERQLRALIIGCPESHEGTCPFCHCSCNQEVDKAMALIDQYTATLTSQRDDDELWTAEDIAAYTGLKNSHAARSWASRHKIARVGERPHPTSGRLQAVYRAEDVRHVNWSNKPS